MGWYALQKAGFSPGTAELVYGLTQLVPVGVEAVLVNRAVNAQIAANAFARETYINPTITRNCEAYFWSGLGQNGDVIAAMVAKENAGVTLETLIANRSIDLPAWDISNPASVKAWQDVSAAYAANASGTVRAVVGSNLRPGNIWENVELPALMANPKVTEIRAVNPVTGQETVIYKRGQ